MELAKKDSACKTAVEAWPHFKYDIRARNLEMFERFQPSSEERSTHSWKDDCYFVPPCYYDAVLELREQLAAFGNGSGQQLRKGGK